MKNTKIETFTDTWNPVQGCLTGCRYCFASKMAKRFGGHRSLAYYMCQEGEFETKEIHILDEPMCDEVTNEAEAYPFGFDPTYCRFRLNGASEIKRPGNIFVCSTGDLFGPWWNDQVIEEVLNAAKAVDWHNYCFLTKFPARYNTLPTPPPNFLFGTSIDTQQRLMETLEAQVKNLRFLSVEPLQERIDLEMFIRETPRVPEWVIVGTETGNSSGRIDTEREWVEEVQSVCEKHGVPLFMKKGQKTKDGSTYMQELMGSKFIQQFHPMLLAKAKKTSGAPKAHR